MDILFVATELAPMAKVGGLADVVFALSKALRILGHSVTLLLPRYPAIEESGVQLAKRLTPLSLEGPEPKTVSLLEGRLGSGVDIVLVDDPGFARRGVYGEKGQDYPDNAERFAVLCRAALALLKERADDERPFDVVHVHDWPTAMIPYMMQHTLGLGRTKNVLSIHNLAHRGVFPRTALAAYGLTGDHFTPERLEFYGDVCFLKGGILAADAVSTVSERYASDIVTPAFGEQLDGVLRARVASSSSRGLVGIQNGIDYAVWNPATDPALVARYDADDPSNKGRSKSALLAGLELPIAPERPLFVSIGRIAHQKGSDVLAAAVERILKLDATLVVAGEGDPELEEGLRRAIGADPERARFLGHVSEIEAHRLVAAADFALLPSRYEPSGLVQLYAQRYGALPIGTRVGGFVDTIVDVDAELETGTGFLFDEPTVDDVVGAVARACTAYGHPRFRNLVRRVMRLDLGWDRPARRYAQLYKSLATR
jgi:starch synthase